MPRKHLPVHGEETVGGHGAVTQQTFGGLSWDHPGWRSGTSDQSDQSDQSDRSAKPETEDVGSEARTSLIYEMQTGSAYGYASWEAGQDPDLLDAYPAQELVRVRQAKVPRDWDTRWRAAAQKVGFNGVAKGPKVALKSSPIWVALSRFERAFPPFDFNSGMWVEDVDREAAVRLGLIGVNEQARPQEKPFAGNWQTSVENLSKELLDSLLRAFPDRVKIVGDKAAWTDRSESSKILPATREKQQSKLAMPYEHRESTEQDASQMADSARTLKSAEANARGSGSPAPAHDEGRSERIARIRGEERRLGEWAEREGLIAQELPTADDLYGEHGVHYDQKSGRYIKFTRHDRHQGYGIALSSYLHGASPAEYLDRIRLQNQIFSDDIRLEGIVKMAGGRLSIITSQPCIVGEAPTLNDIDVLMVGKALRSSPTGHSWINRAALLSTTCCHATQLNLLTEPCTQSIQ